MQPDDIPRGAKNANWFSGFNAIAFQITLGTPMILYARSLGATATVLGVIAAMTPLLNLFQIPAAHHLERIGYRRFILMGWGSRVVFIALIAAVPLMGFLDDFAKMTLVLFCLFIFGLLRGISAGAWMPWITQLIPENVRGRFLSRDHLFMHAGCIAAVALSAWVLGEPTPARFAAVFAVSAAGGAMSLWFLQRIPEVEAPEHAKTSAAPVPWREIVTYPPFFRLVAFNLAIVASVGSLGVFTVPFMKSTLGYSERWVLGASVCGFVGAMAVLPFAGRALDRSGSKAMLGQSLLLYAALLAGWFAMATGLAPGSLAMVAVLQMAAGIAGAAFNLANTRLAMGIMPALGRNHFFAFFTVITSLALGFAPIVWGLALDGMAGLRERWIGLDWNRFSVYFGALCAMVGATAFMARWLIEPPGALAPESARCSAIRGRLQALARLWQK